MQDKNGSNDNNGDKDDNGIIKKKHTLLSLFDVLDDKA